MAWKVVHQEEGEAVHHVTLTENGGCKLKKYMIVGIEPLVGKRVRITVEEEVKDCCERWRGRIVYGEAKTMMIGEHPSFCECCPPKAACAFCPECGERLETP